MKIEKKIKEGTKIVKKKVEAEIGIKKLEMKYMTTYNIG